MRGGGSGVWPMSTCCAVATPWWPTSYVCVPFLATDAYVDSLAVLLRNTLEPQRKVYVEYSNEL